MNYTQEERIGAIPLFELVFYDGAVTAVANINLSLQNYPYSLSAFAQGINIAKLKEDTPLKKEDISGIVQSEVKLNGFSTDIAKLNGAGKASLTEGKLWNLNLLKGLGRVIFADDFSNIVFTEGSCDFAVKDKSISTENLILKSPQVTLYGTGKVGFDGSLDALANLQVSDELVPQGGQLSNFLTGIMARQGNSPPYAWGEPSKNLPINSCLQ